MTTGDGYTVIGEELTAASGKISDAVAPMACWTLQPEDASAASFGHEELAALFTTFCTGLSRAVSTVAADDEKMAGSLEATGRSYAAGDAQVTSVFSPFAGVTP